MTPPRGSRWDGRRAAEIATRRAVMARDAGLARISTVTRWMIAGVLAVSGGLALLAASAFHGRTIANGTSSSSQTSSTQSPGQTTPAQTTPAQTTPAQTTPSSVQAPTTTPAAPVVVSGGS